MSSPNPQQCKHEYLDKDFCEECGIINMKPNCWDCGTPMVEEECKSCDIPAHQLF